MQNIIITRNHEDRNARKLAGKDLKLDFEETEPKINDFAEMNAKIYSSLFLHSHTSDNNLANIK